MRRWLFSGSFTSVVALVAFAAAGFGPSAAAAPQQKDPLTTFCFGVKISVEGIEEGMSFFKSVSGLAVETDVVEFREGDSNEIHKLPGRVRWPNIVLKRGFRGQDPKDPIQKWVRDVALGQDIRKNISIFIMKHDKSGNQEPTPVAQYNFYEAFPVKWQLSELDAVACDSCTETIEIAVERMSPP